jgi:nucleoside-diphosphate-sugar epimerase
MKKAIITGANGFVGSAVVNELLNNGIEVLALGRKSIEEVNQKHLTEPKKFTYLQIDLAEIESLTAKIKKIGWTPGDFCVFYNFAWLGKNGLTDGTIKDQLKNVTYSAKSIAIAKEIGCMKFVNAGSMEETFVEKYIESGWKNQEYHSGQDIYAIAKLGSRDMCRLNAYLHKIDYVHTRFSVYVDDQLSANSFIHKILKKIKNGETYDAPKNNQLFDILKLEEAARAYRLIGDKGVNKSDYFIGTGDPKTLSQYFDQFKNIESGLDHDDDLEFLNNNLLSSADFSINDLTRDTGFKPDITFKKFIKEMPK